MQTLWISILCKQIFYSFHTMKLNPLGLTGDSREYVDKNLTGTQHIVRVSTPGQKVSPDLPNTAQPLFKSSCFWQLLLTLHRYLTVCRGVPDSQDSSVWYGNWEKHGGGCSSSLECFSPWQHVPHEFVLSCEN